MNAAAGTDIVAVARVAALIEAHGSRFLDRWFTAAEVAYCGAKAVPSRHYAARVAAKEAVVKSLGLAWDGPIPWRSVEIVSGERGQPAVRLHGPVRAAAEDARVDVVSVSLAHCDEYATAVALSGQASGDVR